MTMKSKAKDIIKTTFRVVAVVSTTIGFLMIMGAVGQKDYDPMSITLKEVFIESLIGISLIVGAFLTEAFIEFLENNEEES